MRSIVWAFAFAAACSSAAAQQSELDCAVSAFTDYTKTKLALLLQAPLPSVETQISERRLEEQYCLQYAKCLLAGQIKEMKEPNDHTIGWMFSTSFSSCLRDEALEKHQPDSDQSSKRRRQ